MRGKIDPKCDNRMGKVPCGVNKISALLFLGTRINYELPAEARLNTAFRAFIRRMIGDNAGR
jgi:hypothetical protein